MHAWRLSQLEFEGAPPGSSLGWQPLAVAELLHTRQGRSLRRFNGFVLPGAHCKSGTASVTLRLLVQCHCFGKAGG
jgi:hypothetical protein